MKLGVCNFNHEPLHNQGGMSAKGFNIRNITFKHVRLEKQNIIRIWIGK